MSSASLKYLTRRNALNATTKNPVTTNFNHLRAFPRKWLIRKNKFEPRLKSVRPADRIKWWNIVPGDQIRLRGDEDSTIHEVLSINRLSNRVFLKNTVGVSKDEQPVQTKNYHYSRCQLYIGEFDIPSKKNSESSAVRPVFALRIGTSQPAWDYCQKCWVWQRYAVATTPRLPNWQRGQRLQIPWPVKQKVVYPDPGLYETPIEEVAKITYRLPAFDVSCLAPLPERAPETDYLDTIYNPQHGVAYDPSASFETYLKFELSNPHSRAKKMQRWKMYQARVQALRKQITEDEVRYLNGRTVRQAKADAAFKWREIVNEEQKKKKKMRWMHSAQMVKSKRKALKKSTKEEKLRQRLTEMVLTEEPNQVLPSTWKKSSL